MVADSQRLDPALLATRQSDEEPELDKFRLGEVLMELRPESLIGEIGIPENGAGVAKRGLLPFGVAVGVLELQEVVIVGFGEPVLSSLDRSLDASILTGDRLRDIDPAQLLDLVVEHSIEKCGAPRLGEGVQDRRNVGSNRLTLRSRSAVRPSILDDLTVCRVE